ncbi:TetR/AcrR family transcriptional regulator [Paenibacillus sp. DMB5]|uniref:TetR/AcrR family transcriptional regulator n=1 Tax=Paenibacillus sp. DMB5 TaxID=1780103 RepID=UPI00076D877B|nr:TetR/AcrR family transcriptional regulator [Paenibacillus sp. DMB5]KUP20882.1 hypothetical protein AWJ19_06345 [Paenibacillus sp. DMB5]
MSANKIKQSALKLFALKGYEATTMRDVGSEAGIKAASIYSHFESKEVLFLTIVSEVKQQIIWELNEKRIQEASDLKHTLFNIFNAYYQFFSQHEVELRFWQRIRFFPPAGVEQKYDLNIINSSRSLLELYIKLFLSFSNQHQFTHPVEMYVMSYFSFVSGYIDSLLIVPFKLSQEQLHQAFDIYWKGLIISYEEAL